jgi:hypothetical protein
MPKMPPPRRRTPVTGAQAYEAERRIRDGADAIAAAVSYGLVHSLEEAIERNRKRGWADDALQTFRLENDDEVRAAWAILDQRS